MHFRSTHFAVLSMLLCSTTAKVFSIQSYAALGDSYAAGDGAGSSRLFPHLDAICGRFSGAYPVQVANSPHLNVQPFDFWNVACKGATTRSLVFKQLPHVKDVDLVTIQVGGNEVNFFPVVNECIQQWKPISTCDRELDRAKRLIQSEKFVEAFHGMVAHTIKETNGRALLLVLGYAKFFNAETEHCNGVTFSKTNPANVLSNKLRRSFNELVVMLNEVIKASAEAKGAVYVDIDEVFEGHRFCEEGVKEPTPDWEGTWFFRERGEQVEEVLNQMASEQVHGQADQTSLGHSNPLKDLGNLIRTFHPTTNGHVGIAKKVVNVTVELGKTIM